MTPGVGRVFSPELLLLSPDGRLVLVYTVPAASSEGMQQQQEDQQQLEGKQLELRRVEAEEKVVVEDDGRHGRGQRRAPRKARVVFEELCAPGAAAHPSFFLDASRFVHQHVSRTEHSRIGMRGIEYLARHQHVSRVE